MSETRTTINFEMVYKLRPAQTASLNNLKVRYRNEAEARAQKDFDKYTAAITKALGHDDFEVTNICCIADGIMNHVYSPTNGVPTGLGKRKCIYCQCDDFDM